MTIEAFTIPTWLLYGGLALAAFFLGRGGGGLPLPIPGPADPKNPSPLNSILELLMKLLMGGGRLQVSSEPQAAFQAAAPPPIAEPPWAGELIKEIRALRATRI